MSLTIFGRYGNNGVSFNMTPVIDIVFQLIIFFLLAFQFSGTESTQVDLPQGCSFAEKADDGRGWPATVTISRSSEGRILFEVADETIEASSKERLINTITKSLNTCLENLPQPERVVVLRADKSLSYGDAQYALAAAAQSSAAGLQLATMGATSQSSNKAKKAGF